MYLWGHVLVFKISSTVNSFNKSLFELALSKFIFKNHCQVLNLDKREVSARLLISDRRSWRLEGFWIVR